MMEDTAHFCTMLTERSIEREWVDRAMADPDRTEEHDDGTRHYMKKIAAREDRWLRVVVNIDSEPPRRVTAFFDRRLRRLS